jgi:hypothetical protein
MKPNLVLALLLAVSPTISAQDRVVGFDGEQYRLAFVDVANDGAVTNEYLKHGESLESWTTLLAVRRWPRSTGANETAQAWLKTVQPLLSRKARIYQRQTAGDTDVIVEAWLAAPDKSYIEANLHRFVTDEHGGVRAYQFAERIAMTGGRGDPSTFLKRRRDRFDELGTLVVELATSPFRQVR